MTAALLVTQLPDGVWLGIVLAAALAVVLFGFGAGYRYLVKRNHQSDEVADAYANDQLGSRD
ncbi:MAG: hypothetical protein M3211_03305 [Actinomycetota bacterium]|nr:hypothetical protein [Actinomycetota bacterium]